MYKQARMMALMASALLSSTQIPINDDIVPVNAGNNDSTREKYNRLLDKRGVKSWTIDGITVNARNYNNAIKKVNNIKKNIK